MFYSARKVKHIIVGTRMLALQGTLTVAPFHCISSSMDEHALASGYGSPSGSMEWRARAPIPQQHPSLPPQLSRQRADLGSTGSSGEKPPFKTIVPHSSVLLQGIYRIGLTPIGHFQRIPLTGITNIHVVQLPRVLAPDSHSHTPTNIDKV
jgi:hypothetical protein